MAMHAVAKGHNKLYQGFIQEFSLEGEIVASGNMLKLGGLGACSPRKILKFTTSYLRPQYTYTKMMTFSKYSGSPPSILINPCLCNHQQRTKKLWD